MAILVTGGTGFVGSHLVRRLAARRRDVRVLVRSGRKAQAVQGLGLEPVGGDVTDLESLRRACQGVDSVVHLVAVIVERGPATFQAINVGGTANVVRAAQETGVRRLVHMSALGARRDPRFPYLDSKGRGEELVKASGLNYTILQPSIQYGEGDGFLNRLAGLARVSPVLPIAGEGSTRFQPVWVEDVVTCVERVLDGAEHAGESLPFGGPEYLTYEQMVDLVVRTLGLHRWKLHIPMALMTPVATLMERVMPDPMVTPGQLDLLRLDNVADLDSVERLFGFTPARLEEKIEYLCRDQRGALLGE